MSLETFDFPYFKYRTKYPDSSMRVQLGKGYVFTAAPDAPDQRLFILKFNAMKYFLNEAETTLDSTASPNINMWRLEQFYQAHGTHQEFNFTHPMYGAMVCRFNKPLEIPEGIENGGGAVEPFEIELLEVP